MENNKNRTEQKNAAPPKKTKGFWGKMFERLDKAMVEKSKDSSCCSEKPRSGKCC